MVRTVKATVMKLLEGATIYWPLHLPFVQYAYNTKIQALTGSMPFALMLARAPNAPIDYRTIGESTFPRDGKAWVKHQEDMVSLVLPAIYERVAKGQEEYRARMNKRRNAQTPPHAHT